ncbi:ABC transporter ATP-binding protein [Oceanobacillus polygoni]|uniref:Sn-glycerol 3-phosphate transport system ATP-binding protein n=1 Tax=Oceanobacillus polygoni TaxID=1235259 RepID=A0A9X0YQ47_9BACI|nr:ABC transporter ATP-binding protein [Oceanobacillus polygoni]MBP2076875.1 sn-glycerol 3-phosphate transport system ATP-binding protein [Oceanobacillus polygoni]
MKGIEFKNVKKAYGDTTIIENLNLKIHEGERLILLGPSGCGKSTMLRMIAGFEKITDGDLYMNANMVNEVPSGKRNVAMVFQNYALYPHMTAEENITYGLRRNKVNKQEIKRRLDSVVETLLLEPYLKRKPKDLSGGQRQRVALARAVVKESNFFLLDEPLSNLDAQLRVSARKELMNIHHTFKQTMVYVTHDQIEAMTFGERIALMNKGELQMLDTPENVYNRPVNIFTAKFIGSPPTNIMDMVYDNGKAIIGNQSFTFDTKWVKHIEASNATDFVFGIRPEHLQISKSPLENALKGKVKYVENQGDQYAVFIDMANSEVIAMSNSKDWNTDEVIFVQPMADHIHIFDKATTNSIGYPGV